jgi:hypothetical protein
MNIIDKILTQQELLDKPPILIDIGASGFVNDKWKKIAKYSVCIAFDADNREMSYIVDESSKYKKMYIYNCIVTNFDTQKTNFYLTQSPYCSSILQPDYESLQNYEFADLFKVEKTIELSSKELKKILNELKINYIDWFKTDSQGTDLRLFVNLGGDIINNVLVAEFEPGILDSYKGEDKLYSLMEYMDNHNFWMSDILIKGNQRINHDLYNQTFNQLEKKLINDFLKISPGWAEVSYLNKCNEEMTKRDLLLAWIFSIIEKQYGFALEVAIQGENRFHDLIFEELKIYTLNQLKVNLIKNFPFIIFKKINNKLLNILSKITK